MRLAAGSISSGLPRRSARGNSTPDGKPTCSNCVWRPICPWTRNRRLPASLDELHKEAGTALARDPQSGAAYGYAVKAGDGYELCAEFARASELGGDFWSHGEGRQCFQITAKALTP